MPSGGDIAKALDIGIEQDVGNMYDKKNMVQYQDIIVDFNSLSRRWKRKAERRKTINEYTKQIVQKTNMTFVI